MQNSQNPMVQSNANMNTMMRGTPRTTEPQIPGINTPQPTAGVSPQAKQPTSAPGFTIHPPGVPSNSDEYNYEPQPDNSWKVYTPGVAAPPTAYQASMPSAASNSDLMRMRQELSGIMSGPGV